MAEVKVSALTALTGANVANGDELYIVDTGSPNVSKKITADELAASGPFSSRYAPQAGDTIFISAASFGPFSGSPTLGSSATSGANWSCWLLDASSAEYVGSGVILPSYWATFDVNIWWTVPATTGAGDVRWWTLRRFAGDGDLVDTGTSSQVTATAPSAKTMKVTSMVTGASITTNKQLLLQVGRDAADAGDTLANDCCFLGVSLVRAS